MENLIRPCDKEYMRMAMLKHEETFKEQVCELHRLYRIQKVLMKNIEANNRGRSFKNSIRVNRNSHHHHKVAFGSCLNETEGEESMGQYFFTRDRNQTLTKVAQDVRFDLERPVSEEIAESESDEVLELTLGPSSYNNRKKPLTPDSGQSFSSSSSGSSLIHRTRCWRNHHNSGGIIGLVKVPHSSGIRNGYDIEIEESSRSQERSSSKHPPWLFSVLSLNIN